MLLVAVDRNGGGAGRTYNVVRIGRQRENDRLVGFGNRVIDGLDRDRGGGLAGANGSVTAEPPVIHAIGRGAADRVEHVQITVGASHASDAEFPGVKREFGGIGIGSGDGNSGRRWDNSEAGAGIIKKHDRASNEKIIGSVVGTQISGASLELQRAGAGRRNCAAERRAEVAVRIVGSVAGIGTGVRRAAPTQAPINCAAIALPSETPRCEIAGRDNIGHREVGDRGRYGVAGKSRTSNQDMIANRAVGDIADRINDGNWVESSGVEHDEFTPADKVLTGCAHAQLDGLRGRVATNAADDLFDLHQVKRGMGGGL